jgi:signal transduction histidine kinase
MRAVTFDTDSRPSDQVLHAEQFSQRHSTPLAPSRHETFVATLAHELRQPLSTLLAAVEVIRLTTDSPDAQRASAIMKRQVSQMSRVIEDLVDASRWARGKVTLRTTRLDLRDVMREAALDVAAAASARGHTLVMADAPEPLWVDGDPQRLHQVFSNLLGNAVKYCDPGGRIALAASQDSTTITLRVSDTGQGIEPQALRLIFDFFTQVRPLEGIGLGIGLAVAHEIVALHGGRIEARSEGVGRGSEFIVTLPLLDDAFARALAARAALPRRQRGDAC